MNEILLKLFDGLKFYEIILMIVGIILLIAIIVWVSILIKKNKTYLPMLLCSIIPAIMIGWPSLKSIKYKEIIIELNNQVNKTINSPSEDNYKKLDSLEKITNQFNIKDPKTNLLLAKANIILSNTAKAEEIVGKEVTNTELNEFNSVREDLIKAQLISKLNAIIENHNIDSAQAHMLRDKLKKISSSTLPIKNKETAIKRVEDRLNRYDSLQNIKNNLNKSIIKG
ncbi:MAG: hypothetical protein IT267_05775 [Saprospiraceae bacterium]|nr:hypothetical protein [Saprospiraceae bacterium]